MSLTSKKRIAIFASGNGSNVEAIVNYFSNHSLIEVVLILSNNKNAFVLERAKQLKIESYVFSKPELYDSDNLIEFLKLRNINFIVLAGFLWLIPNSLLTSFNRRIINIHPSLLPKYGGKGMYGKKVHEEILKNKENITGITIHLLNEKYDEGKILFQQSVDVDINESVETLTIKIQKLEHEYYPKIIENYILHQ
jgi:phosphoribosylglycinamide formyltransferase-1